MAEGGPAAAAWRSLHAVSSRRSQRVGGGELSSSSLPLLPSFSSSAVFSDPPAPAPPLALGNAPEVQNSLPPPSAATASHAGRKGSLRQSVVILAPVTMTRKHFFPLRISASSRRVLSEMTPQRPVEEGGRRRRRWTREGSAWSWLVDREREEEEKRLRKLTKKKKNRDSEKSIRSISRSNYSPFPSTGRSLLRRQHRSYCWRSRPSSPERPGSGRLSRRGR